MSKKITVKAMASYFYVQIGTVIISEIFSQMYNPTQDASYIGRLFLAMNPKLYIFVIIFCVFTAALIRWYLSPLWKELSKPESERGGASGQRARMVAVRLPWFLMIYNSVQWIFAILLFYFLSGKAMPSGLPLVWVLTIKLSEALASSLLNAFIIDGFLQEPKQLLHITSYTERERDLFIESKAIVLPMAFGVIMITHVAFITWYYIVRNPALQGPNSPIFSILTVGFLVLVVLFFIAFLSQKQDVIQNMLLVNQIRALTAGASADLNKKVAILNFDRIGKITENFNNYLSVLHNMVWEIRNGSLNLQSNGLSLDEKILEAGKKIEEINYSVSAANEQIAKQITATGDSSTAVKKIGERATDLHAAVIQQTQSVSNSSAGIEQMIANILAVTSNVERVNTTCENLLNVANLGKEKISDSNMLIGKVVEASSLLLDANKMIANIAAQTNLLAMNAAIEAAHAGAAGAGFAVVADEIRSLAEKSSQQSSIVNSHLKEVRGAIQNAVTSSNEASKGFDDVLGLITTVTSMEQENAHAMQEQKEGSTQVAKTLHEMQQTTEVVGGAAKSLTLDLDNLASSIAKLVECANQFQTELNTIALDTQQMTQTFTAVTSLKEKNAEISMKLEEQVNRFML